MKIYKNNKAIPKMISIITKDIAAITVTTVHTAIKTTLTIVPIIERITPILENLLSGFCFFATIETISVIIVGTNPAAYAQKEIIEGVSMGDVIAKPIKRMPMTVNT